MNRHYDTAEYSKIVYNIRKTFDNSSITTDVMVGFAGETEDDFKDSMNFVKQTGFAKVHVFPYSRRKGTVADKAPNQIAPNIKEQRAKSFPKDGRAFGKGPGQAPHCGGRRDHLRGRDHSGPGEHRARGCVIGGNVWVTGDVAPARA